VEAEVGDPVALECGSRPSQACPRGIGLASESAASPAEIARTSDSGHAWDAHTLVGRAYELLRASGRPHGQNDGWPAGGLEIPRRR
jgi:hypothetical protein